ncbi:MAG: C40 family peptidase [Chlorobia bacterium]|nr:C40 family peptidase [Fimbriimonadaceae bacterium]
MIRAVLALTILMGSVTAFAEKKVLGKLGQATERTPIYASMRTNSRVYYRVKQYEYLVVTDSSKDNWMKVLLKNGQYGYVPADTVAKLPYEVTTEAQPRNSRSAMASPGSRGYAADAGLQFRGTPYVWGGNDLNRGIDCSGFVKKLFGAVGVNLPRTASEQALVGQRINRLEDLQKGDRLYFWENKRNKIGHTGIYLGGGYFVHSSRGKNGVDTDYLGSPKWLKILVAARR